MANTLKNPVIDGDISKAVKAELDTATAADDAVSDELYINLYLWLSNSIQQERNHWKRQLDSTLQELNRQHKESLSIQTNLQQLLDKCKKNSSTSVLKEQSHGYFEPDQDVANFVENEIITTEKLLAELEKEVNVLVSKQNDSDNSQESLDNIQNGFEAEAVTNQSPQPMNTGDGEDFLSKQSDTLETSTSSANSPRHETVPISKNKVIGKQRRTSETLVYKTPEKSVPPNRNSYTNKAAVGKDYGRQEIVSLSATTSQENEFEKHSLGTSSSEGKTVSGEQGRVSGNVHQTVSNMADGIVSSEKAKSVAIKPEQNGSNQINGNISDQNNKNVSNRRTSNDPNTSNVVNGCVCDQKERLISDQRNVPDMNDVKVPCDNECCEKDPNVSRNINPKECDKSDQTLNEEVSKVPENRHQTGSNQSDHDDQKFFKTHGDKHLTKTNQKGNPIPTSQCQIWSSEQTRENEVQKAVVHPYLKRKPAANSLFSVRKLTSLAHEERQQYERVIQSRRKEIKYLKSDLQEAVDQIEKLQKVIQRLYILNRHLVETPKIAKDKLTEDDTFHSKKPDIIPSKTVVKRDLVKSDKKVVSESMPSLSSLPMLQPITGSELAMWKLRVNRKNNELKKSEVSQCLRCQKLFRPAENNSISCRFHRNGQESTEKYDITGKLVRVVYKWACCHRDVDAPGCTHSRHI